MSSAAYREGLRLFEEHSFFEAHEVLEDVWRAAPEPERKFLQGLIQVAVALHHHSRGNLVGCRSLLSAPAAIYRRIPRPMEESILRLCFIPLTSAAPPSTKAARFPHCLEYADRNERVVRLQE